MSDTIGRIVVPAAVNSGLTFPLISDFGYGVTRPFPTITHRFGSRATKTYQTFQVGIGPRRFPFRRAVLSKQHRSDLLSFYESVQGSYQRFTYNAPQADKSTTPFSVIFEQQPLSLEELSHWTTTGFNFVECVTDTLTRTIYSVDTRFPSNTLQTALLSQVQVIYPLIHIKVRDPGVPDIWLSDRRLTLRDGAAVQSTMGWAGSSQLYLPRLLGIGEPNSNVIMSQDISGAADDVRFNFADADNVMSSLANDCDLKYASIDLCLYHENTGICLQLWKGFIQDFEMSEDSPDFPIHCTDGFYQLTQQYPQAVASRQCRKTFKVGDCPWASVSGVGDPTACDYYFDSANGCVSHVMQIYFGGQPAHPQGVRIKDNSTGILRFGRDSVTATSIISDTVFGSALPEIYCHDHGDPLKACWVNALLVSVRDEGDFFDMLGIVGAGPLGAYTGMTVGTNADGFKVIIAPLGDGFPPHGFKVDSNLTITTNTGLGLREILGTDPANATTDPFSLGQVSGPGTSSYGPEYAAGTAFVELRYAKLKGINPSTPDQHTMQIPISQGLSGFVWNSSGTRSVTAGLTNPFWIAVNTLLRARGMQNASAADQLATFILSSLTTGGGAGTAEIADLVVSALLGGGTETQFQFQGKIDKQKPFRDWLTDILNCALGYYTWEFGKLRLGIRENASVVEAFTQANMIFQSLTLTPIRAEFEDLMISFADQAYQFQANTAEYIDKDHAAYYGRQGSPLQARLNSPGICTLSQGLRVAATRVREETGGINAAEWAKARVATWRTTILALNTAVGQVDSITNAKVPGGVGKFRIQRWTLRSDYSIEITGKTVTDSMYDLTIGPKPSDVLPKPLPPLFYPIPLGEWAPFQVQANSADYLFPSEYSFDVAESYTDLKDGTALATAVCTGKLAVNSFIEGAGGPQIVPGSSGVTLLSTGGSILGGITLRVSITAENAGKLQTPPSQIIIVKIPAGTNTNQFTLTGIKWPVIAGLTGYVVHASTDDDLICRVQTGSLTDTGGAVYTPTSITVLGPLERSTIGMPNPNL